MDEYYLMVKERKAKEQKLQDVQNQYQDENKRLTEKFVVADSEFLKDYMKSQLNDEMALLKDKIYDVRSERKVIGSCISKAYEVRVKNFKAT